MALNPKHNRVKRCCKRIHYLRSAMTEALGVDEEAHIDRALANQPTTDIDLDAVWNLPKEWTEAIKAEAVEIAKVESGAAAGESEGRLGVLGLGTEYRAHVILRLAHHLEGLLDDRKVSEILRLLAIDALFEWAKETTRQQPMFLILGDVEPPADPTGRGGNTLQ